jgi:hypothetical protein
LIPEYPLPINHHTVLPHDAQLDSGNPNPSASEAGRGQIVGNRDSGEQPESGFEEARFMPMPDFGMSPESRFMPVPLFGLHNPNDVNYTDPSNGSGFSGFMPMPMYGLNFTDLSNGSGFLPMSQQHPNDLNSSLMPMPQYR